MDVRTIEPPFPSLTIYTVHTYATTEPTGPTMDPGIVGIVGIGQRAAGDDGVGPGVVARLRE